MAIHEGKGRIIPVESKTTPGKFYEVEVDPLGFIVGCPCLGYANRRKCWHTREVGKLLKRPVVAPVARCGGCDCPLDAPLITCFCDLCAALHGAIIFVGGEAVRRKARPMAVRPPLLAKDGLTAIERAADLYA